MTKFTIIDPESFANGTYTDLEARYVTIKEIPEEVAKKYLQILNSNTARESRKSFLQRKKPFVKAGWERYICYINKLKKENK